MHQTTITVYMPYKSDLADHMVKALAALSALIEAHGGRVETVETAGEPIRKAVVGYEQSAVVTWSGEASEIREQYHFSKTLTAIR